MRVLKSRLASQMPYRDFLDQRCFKRLVYCFRGVVSDLQDTMVRAFSVLNLLGHLLYFPVSPKLASPCTS